MRLLLLTLCIILFGGNTLRLEAKKYFFSNYNFCHITEEAGLPNNSVTAVMKDSFGYIWVATQDGLARYDGYRFLSYGVRTSLPLERKLCLHIVRGSPEKALGRFGCRT